MANGTEQTNTGRIVVAYCSVTGNTARVARDIASRTGADLATSSPLRAA